MNLEKTFRIGCVNWDACVPSESYFGKWASTTLGDEQFRDRWPFYADTSDGHLSFHWRTQEETDAELEFAAAAGIDYFAYCWYTDDDELEKSDPLEWENHVGKGGVRALNHARQMHLKSQIRDKVMLCAIYRPDQCNQADMTRLLDSMREDWYEKIDGRPLVFLFGYGKSAIERQLSAAAEFRTAATARGMPQPFLVPMNSVSLKNGGRNQIFDAVSQYALGVGDVCDWKEFSCRAVELNDNLKPFERPIIPTFSAGWNPRPRIVRPVPWCGYADSPYILPAKGDYGTEMAELKKWIAANRRNVLNHMMVFAWNEFEEGGWLCPTKGRDGTINSTRIEEFRKVLALYIDTWTGEKDGETSARAL